MDTGTSVIWLSRLSAAVITLLIFLLIHFQTPRERRLLVWWGLLMGILLAYVLEHTP